MSRFSLADVTYRNFGGNNRHKAMMVIIPIGVVYRNFGGNNRGCSLSQRRRAGVVCRNFGGNNRKAQDVEDFRKV